MVTSESRTERQRIERLALAKERVSSKMSRSKKTENQPSSDQCQSFTSP